MRDISRRDAMALLGLPLLGLPATLHAAEADAPRRGGTLTYAVVAELPTYDLHATSTFAAMHRLAPHYSTLLRYEPHNYPHIVGDAAESWTVSPDNLTWTFRLHPGIRFHDGTELTSEDVRATYDRLRAPPQGVVSDRLPSFQRIDRIETPDPVTVVFHLKEVDASMLTTFASPWNALYSAAKLKADPNFPATQVLGTGPFRFKEHVAGSHWVGERFDGYFRQGQPYLDGFRAINMTTSAAVTALSGRQVQAEFRGFSPAERDRITQALGHDADVQEAGWLLHMCLDFNCQRKPFDDPRVRRALSLALDRWGGAQSLARISPLAIVGGLVRPGSEWSASEAEMQAWPGYGRDIAANRAEAKRLLREAGAENLSFKLLDRDHTPYTTAGIFAIDQWRQIGVKVEHQTVELATWYAMQTSGNYDVMVDSFTQFSDDPTTVLVKYISYERSPVAIQRQTDPELDRLFDQQARTADQAERIRLIRQFETRLFEASYSVPILWWKRIVVMNARVRNWTMSPSHMIYQDLGNLWLAPET